MCLPVQDLDALFVFDDLSILMEVHCCIGEAKFSGEAHQNPSLIVPQEPGTSARGDAKVGKDNKTRTPGYRLSAGVVEGRKRDWV